MDQLADLIAAVAAAPEDDAPRLVYADWLIERGDPLGELVVLQCALARAEGADEPMQDEGRVVAREQALRAMHDDRWFGVLKAIADGGYAMRRGFVEHMTAWRVRDFVDHAEELAERAPLLRSLAIGGDVVLATGVEAMKQLRAVSLVEAGPLDAATFHPFVVRELLGVKRLEFLNVTRDRETASAVVELPLEVELEHLAYSPRRVIGHGPGREDAIPWVLRAIAARQRGLRSLQLGRCYGLSLDGLDELAPTLERLVLQECAIGAQLGAIGAAARGLVELVIEGDQLAADDLATLLDALPGLRRLRLRNVGLRDEHAEAIAGAAGRALRRLDVAHNRIDDDGVKALLEMRGLVRLEVAGNVTVSEGVLAAVKKRERLAYRPPLAGYPEDIVTELERGNKIAAIKHYRELTGLGLANALHAIERITDERS